MVDQQVYSGLGSAGGINPGFEQLVIGDKIRVFYNPDDPKESFLGDPKDQLVSTSKGILFLAIVGSTFSMAGLYLKGWPPGTKRESI
jgi:hypothetical protein